MGLAGREREGSGQIFLHYINRVYKLYYHSLEFSLPRDSMFLIFLFNYFIFRDLNKNSKGERLANPPKTARKETDSERKKATRLEETAMAIQLAEAGFSLEGGTRVPVPGYTRVSTCLLSN